MSKGANHCCVAALTLLVGLLSVSCSAAGEAGQEARSNVNVAIGMTVDELRAGSTYPFGPDPSAGGGSIGSYQITTPYSLVFHNGDREFVLEDIGMEVQSAFIVVTEGRITNFTLPAQRELLTLDDAIDRARVLSEQLRDAGFAGDRTHFHPQNMRRGAPRPNISNLEEARAALADPALVIAEMSLFVGETPDLSASLVISSGPRMLELQSIPGQPENPVSAAIREARRGREWTLQLSIGPNVFGPTPLVTPD